MLNRREDFQKMAATMSAELGQAMLNAMMKAYDAFTLDELNKFDSQETPSLLVRAIGMAVGDSVVDNRFNVAAIEKLTPQVKRTLNRRGV